MNSTALVAGLQRHVGNPIVAAILRSPAHGLLSRSVILLTLRGRRTGTWHTVPVGYVAQEGAIDVLVANRQVKGWWRNLEGGAPVELVLRGRTMRATAQALTSASREHLRSLCATTSRATRKALGWSGSGTSRTWLGFDPRPARSPW